MLDQFFYWIPFFTAVLAAQGVQVILIKRNHAVVQNGRQLREQFDG